MPECPLEGWYGVKCTRDFDNHHIMNRGKLTKKQIKYVERLPDIFMIKVCSNHNRERWADTPEARTHLFKLKIDEHGEEAVREAINGIPWKVVPYEFTFMAIIGE